MKKILFALFAFLFLVACEDEPTTEIVKALRLSVDKEVIFADDTEIVTFTVKDEKANLVSDATIYIAETDEALVGNTFKTKDVGVYRFYARKESVKSNEVSVTARR